MDLKLSLREDGTGSRLRTGTAVAWIALTWLLQLGAFLGCAVVLRTCAEPEPQPVPMLDVNRLPDERLDRP